MPVTDLHAGWFGVPNLIMRTLAKPKKPAKRRYNRRVLPPISSESPLYGHDSFIGCVSLDLPQGAEARRTHLRARIHADNHS